MNSRGCSVIVRKSFRVRNELLSPPGLQQQEIGTSRYLCFGEVALIRASGLRPFQCSRTAHERLRLFLPGPFWSCFCTFALPSNTAMNNKATSRTGEPGRVSRRGGGGELRCGKHVSI